MARYTSTERSGVNAVESIVINDLKWIFREQPIADMGIDAHIERVDGGTPTGKLIGIQIKTGESHFRESDEFLTYYGENIHLEYWTGHSLPVLLVAHLPERGETYWAHIEPSSVIRTKKAWKVEIPKANVLGPDSEKRLFDLFEGSPADQRLRKLLLDEPLMRHIASGGKVSVELECWVNKSLGRTPVQVFIHDRHGNEVLSQEWFQYYVGYGMKELAETLFPWSLASVDKEFYEEQIDEIEEERLAFEKAVDEDNGVYWDGPGDSVYPYAEMSGEVECYRLVLTLNKLGQAFLIVSDHISGRP